MSPQTDSPSRPWFWGFLGLGLLLLLWMPTACGTPQLGLRLYQGDASKALALTQLGTVYKPPLALTSSDGTTDLIDLGAPSVKLPKFRCQEWLKRIAEDKASLDSSEGAALGLLPSMVINGFVGDKLALTGRFPLDVACHRLKASILMAPAGQLSPWRPREDSRSSGTPAWDRVGHAIVRLPDGRYLVSGGAGSLSYDEKGLPQVSKLPTSTFVYNPATGTLEDGPALSQARAFHGAVVWKEGVFVLGGIDDKGQIVATEGWRLPGLTPLAAADFPSEITALTPRAWQTVLKLKEADAAGATKERIVQVGGVSCPPAAIKAECKGEQLLHAQVVVMPKRKLVVVIGGVYFVKGFEVWRPLGQLHIYSYAALSSPFALDDASTKQDFSPPRMGHVAVRQAENKIWVFGGVGPRNDNASLTGANRINAINVLTFDAESRISIDNLFVVGDDQPLGRVLSTGIPLDKGRILVLGGFLRAPANKSDPGTLAKDALVLGIDPNDSSKTTLQVHTLAQTPRLLPLAYLLPTGQHWISGGAALGASATGPLTAAGGIQLYNPRPEIDVGALVKFELLRPEPSPDEPAGSDEPSTQEPGQDSDAGAGDAPRVDQSGPDASVEPTPDMRTEVPPEMSFDTTSGDRANPDAPTVTTGIKWCRRTSDNKGFVTSRFYQKCAADEVCVPCRATQQCEDGAGICQPECDLVFKRCRKSGDTCTRDKGQSRAQFCFQGCGSIQAPRDYSEVCPLGTICERADVNQFLYGNSSQSHCRASRHYEGWATGNKLLGQSCAPTDGCDGSKGFFCRQNARKCARACDPRKNSKHTCPSGQTCKVDIESFLQGRCE